jgi:exodeoxyribonuclease V beta subunit
LWRNRWYILDWKSNHLGNTPDDYGPEALQKAMEDNHYLLQAHLYTVAWCRHLASSGNFDYERDFGGVFYVFLRGVDPRHESRTGLYFLRPQAADITTLGDLL